MEKDIILQFLSAIGVISIVWILFIGFHEYQHYADFKAQGANITEVCLLGSTSVYGTEGWGWVKAIWNESFNFTVAYNLDCGRGDDSNYCMELRKKAFGAVA